MELLINNLLFSALLLFCLNWADVNGASGPNKPYYVVPVKSLLPSSYCVGSKGSGSAVGSQKLKVTTSYGPCSPLGHKKKIPSAYQDFSQDKARVDFINGRMEKLTATMDLSSASYVVKIGFGTPKKEYTLTVDTGSDITWIQCLPCSKTCYFQKEQPMFDPSKSSSYRHGFCKPNSENTYNISYNDNSYSNGVYGCDNVTFDKSHVFPNFQFGCGQNNSDGFGTTAGMLGLGRGDISFVSQTASQFGKFFSYCFPPTSSDNGYLLFGHEARNFMSSRTFTPLLKNPQYPSFYFVNLTGITVGNKKLKVSASVFSSPGTIIDSGTVITRLPQSAYSALKSAFQESMSQYPSVPPPAGEPMLDTCYNLSRYQNVNITVVVLHFGEGTNVTLDQSGIITAINKTRIFCLAFAAKKEGDLAIIGNTQQKAMDILYDLKGEQIGFGKNRCHI